LSSLVKVSCKTHFRRLRRVWRGLLLAAFMNTQSEFYYRMLSNFMGQGDKETFPFALLATNASFHLISTPVGSVGLNKCACCACVDDLAG